MLSIMCCCYSVWKCIIFIFLFCISVVRPYGRALCFRFLPVLVLIHFILLYMLRYYYYIRVIIMYTCLCIPVLVVTSSIVYLNHIISSTLFFRFLLSSYRPAQSRNMDVFVKILLIMSFNPIDLNPGFDGSTAGSQVGIWREQTLAPMDCTKQWRTLSELFGKSSGLSPQYFSKALWVFSAWLPIQSFWGKDDLCSCYCVCFNL